MFVPACLVFLCCVGHHPIVRMCSSNELDVDQDLPVVPSSATGSEVST